MSEQFFKNPNECLKWCLDHPGQRCRDGEGREIWFLMDSEADSNLHFCTNIDTDGKTVRGEEFNLFPNDLKYFDLTTLRPVEAEPEKPTLDNLAALENWDWFEVTLPNGRTYEDTCYGSSWVSGYIWLYIALSAGWPVEFGRDEA